MFVIFSKSQLAKEKTGEKQEKQITNGRIQLKDEENEETWEVLKSTTMTDDDRIGTNGMVKKIQ